MSDAPPAGPPAGPPTVLHDWTRAPAGAWHHFHFYWVAELGRTLNAGLLPDPYYAYAEPQTGVSVDGGGGDEDDPDETDRFGGRRFEGDLLTLKRGGDAAGDGAFGGGVALAERPPRAAVTAPLPLVAAGPRRIAVRHRSGDRTVALIEVASRVRTGISRIVAFGQRIEAALRAGVHVLLIDPFPATPLLPAGLPGEVADRFGGDYEPPGGEVRAVASYRAAGEATTSFLDPLPVGGRLPEVPLFLTAERYVNLPLADGYAAAWAACPRHVRALLSGLSNSPAPAPAPPAAAAG